MKGELLENKLVDKKNIAVLFMNINTICELSEKLLDYFKSCLEKFSPTSKFA